MTYWNHSGKYQKISERLFEHLVPVEGMCNTVEGELLRAIGNIYYDFYNNGWGCNNFSGAVNYLRVYNMISLEEKSKLHDYSHGEPFKPCYDASNEYVLMLEEIYERVVEYIMFRKGERAHNTTDMTFLMENQYVEEVEE